MNPVTTVLLDLDDTILMDDEATDAAFMACAMHAVNQYDLDPTTLIRAVKDAAKREWREGPCPDWLDGIGTSAYEGLRARFDGEDPHWAEMREFGPGFRRTSWNNGLVACGVNDYELAGTLDEMFGRERAETNPYCVGAESALAWLRERFSLGMVTNGIPDVQQAKIINTGLDDRFDAIVISGVLGVGKPEPAIYDHILRGLGAVPEETIMIGDNLVRDVGGSQALGMRGVWISMGRDLPEDADIEPWLTVELLGDLPAVLEAMG